MNNSTSNVSRETHEKLSAFAELVKKWTVKINLIAPSTIPDIWDRHIMDSWQLINSAPQNWSSWLDIGSGGGFPGIVIAIAAEQDQFVTLVESDARKCAFLRTCIRELSLDATVENARIEDITPSRFDVISSRATAALPQLFDYSLPFFGRDSVAIFPKGKRYQQEIDAASVNWTFDLEIIPSRTEAEAKILRIERMARSGADT